MQRSSYGFAQLSLFTLPLIALLLLFVLTWPVWHWLWGEWMQNQYYSHGVLIPLVSLFLIVQRLRHDRSVVFAGFRGDLIGFTLLTISVVGFLWFLQSHAWFMTAFAMVGIVTALIWTFTGVAFLGKLLFPIAYLVMMAPLPMIERWTLPLALFTGVCSGALVRFFGLDVTIVGNAVTLPNADLVIGAQCSGVNSLIALTAIMTLAAYLLQGPLWGKLLLVLSAIPLALLGNILRVASLLVVARFLGAESAFTFYHDYSGILFFVVVLLLLFPLARLLRCSKLRLDVL
jgi:exosortase